MTTLSLSVLVGTLGATTTSSTVDPDLDAFVQQYEEVDSVQLVADVEVILVGETYCDTVFASPGELITGRFQYVAAADRYWILPQLDPLLVSAMDFEVAFNGDEFQVLQRAASPNGLTSLRVGDGDRNLGIPILPNPFLVPLEFIYVRDDLNWWAPLKLGEVARDASTLDRISDVQRETVSVKGRTMERATMSGGELEGEPFEFHVYTPIGKRSQPAMIECVTSAGVLVRTELSHYRSASGGPTGSSWPRSIVLSSFDEQGQLAARISFMITSLTIDEEINPTTFTIDPARADRTWSESLGSFID